MPNINSEVYSVCNLDMVGNLTHPLLLCPYNNGAGQFLLEILKQHIPNRLPKQVILLDLGLAVGDDLKLTSDAALISFGANSEITMTHVHDTGLTLTHTATGDNTPMVLQLKSEEDAIIANEVIGSLEDTVDIGNSGIKKMKNTVSIEAIEQPIFVVDGQKKEVELFEKKNNL